MGIAIPHQGKYVYQTAAECKDQCARTPACRYGTYISAGTRRGECWLAAQTGVGEVHGTRASCNYLHLPKHWTKSDGEGLGWTWSRLGKSNQKLQVRLRDFPHARALLLSAAQRQRPARGAGIARAARR